VLFCLVYLWFCDAMRSRAEMAAAKSCFASETPLSPTDNVHFLQALRHAGDGRAKETVNAKLLARHRTSNAHTRKPSRIIMLET